MSKSSSNYFVWWFIGCIFFFCIVSFVILQYRIDRLENPITPTEVSFIDVEQSLLSQGWVKECSEFVNVSTYKFVDEYVGSNCPPPMIRVIACSNNGGGCFKMCYNDILDNVTVPAHVEYYNVSVCTKFILVKGGLYG